MQNNNRKTVQTKGFYILLAALVLVIGVSSYAFFSGASKEQEELAQAGLSVPSSTQLPESEDTAPTMQTSGKTGLGHGAESRTVMPVSGQVLQEYAMDRLAFNATTKDWRTHNGVDLAAPIGTQVQAAKSGTVEAIFEDEYYGMTIRLQHADGYSTTYSGLEEKTLVEAGDKVTAGQPIGTVGDTALIETAMDAHLHFEVSCNGETVDPAGFLYQ